MDFYFFLDSRICGNDTKDAPSPGLAFGQAGLSHRGETRWLHPAKMVPFFLGESGFWVPIVGQPLGYLPAWTFPEGFRWGCSR